MVELEKYHHSIGYVGVNNRDLKTFRVDRERSMELIGHIPESAVAVSESGISSKDEINRMWEVGFRLFLMGETFMSQNKPGEACKKLIEEL
jgi:indole-3-glycerol phosphate synthase